MFEELQKNIKKKIAKTAHVFEKVDITLVRTLPSSLKNTKSMIKNINK